MYILITKKAEKQASKELPEVTPLSRVQHGPATFAFSTSIDCMKFFVEVELAETEAPFQSLAWKQAEQ